MVIDTNTFISQVVIGAAGAALVVGIAYLYRKLFGSPAPKAGAGAGPKAAPQLR
jgi:hypothetical protein